MGLRIHFNLKRILTIIVVVLMVSTSIYLYQEIKRINRIHQQIKAVSDKVTLVMKLYNCEDRQIHDTIMETFDPVLIAIVIGVESEYRIKAVSPTGCRGLMQLSPDKLNDWENVRLNIHTGARYLKEQLDRFGNLELAIAAYNAGPENVSKYKGVPPYRETKAYIEKAKLLSLAFDHFMPWTAERIHPLL